MKAIRVNQMGAADVMQLEDMDVPQPAAGEALVRVLASGVNFIDTYQRSGAYKMKLPYTPGQEGAGVIEALGAGGAQRDLEVGMRVAWYSSGGAYAEYALIPQERLVAVPDTIDDETAAALLLQGMTAHYLATSTYHLTADDSALIHAAAGGTGGLLVQIAKRAGARVLGTVGSQEKAVRAKQLGADEVILYREVDFEAAVKQLTDGRGVDVVYDSVGKTTFDKGLNVLRPRGLMVLWGQASGPVPPLDLQVLNAKGSLYVTRPSLGAYTATRADLLARAYDLFAWVQAGELKVNVDRTFPLADAAEAHRYLEDRKSQGKVLLIP